MEFLKNEIKFEETEKKDIKGIEKYGDTKIFEKEILKPINDLRDIDEILDMKPIFREEYLKVDDDKRLYENLENGKAKIETYEDKQEKIEEILEDLSVESILELAEKYPKVYNKLISAEKSIINDLQSIQNNPENEQKMLENVEQKIARFKGDLIEAIIKEGLSDNFDNILDKEQQVDIGDGKKTNIDVTCENAKEDIKIGDVEVKKGENLYIESKVGDASYIRGQMDHMIDQVTGHHEAGKQSGNGYKSIIVVSKDYLNISENKRSEFEEKIKDLGTEVVILDKSASEIESKAKNVIGGLS